MRINPVPQFPETQQAEATSSVRKGETQPESSATSASADVATLSTGTEQVSALALQLQGVPEVRQERVKELQKAIQQGTFHVSDHQIANAMLSELEGPDSGQQS
ncbi:MAG: flagellar biosynthesis anti-sigma factor FlgM [Terriglobia bacterium]